MQTNHNGAGREEKLSGESWNKSSKQQSNHETIKGATLVADGWHKGAVGVMNPEA